MDRKIFRFCLFEERDFSLIMIENTETSENIFRYLKINYYFNPSLKAVNLGKAGLKAIYNIFLNTKIFPCYFHLMRRLNLHIKNLK